MQNKMEQTKDWYENESSELRLALGKAAKRRNGIKDKNMVNLWENVF